MKKYILVVFIMLFPYFSLILMFNGVVFDNIHECIVIIFALIASIVYLICAIRNKWQAKSLALANMIVKLVHIPAYILTFLIGSSGLIFIKLIAITLLMFLFDCITISLSGIIALSAGVRARTENKISTVYMVIFCISSFVFCIDVISAVVLYIKLKRLTKIYDNNM